MKTTTEALASISIETLTTVTGGQAWQAQPSSGQWNNGAAGGAWSQGGALGKQAGSNWANQGGWTGAAGAPSTQWSGQ